MKNLSEVGTHVTKVTHMLTAIAPLYSGVQK
uniref:Uncharacterized protein n=1 Tax=Physcomitrium patens TaxID=3218 RepID=A0A2K1J822_PHYPA|nr:hypothetical protein PHYPA_020799 [Physcomitrium patens]